MFNDTLNDMDMFDTDCYNDIEDDMITDMELVSDDEIENLILNDNPYAHMENDMYY